MLHSLLWVIPQLANFICRRFGTPIKMERTECSEMAAHKIHTPGNHPRERIRSRWTNFLNRTTT